MKLINLLILFSLLLTACASNAGRQDKSTLEVSESALDKRLDRGRIVILGQPNAEDFRALSEEGVKTVINIRTDKEMSELSPSLDESKLTMALGQVYIHEPVGGDIGWSPKAVDALAQAMNENSGKIALHCASGNRAGMVYAAYAVKYLQTPPLQAMQEIAPLGAWPLPLEKLSGVPLILERADSKVGSKH